MNSYKAAVQRGRDQLETHNQRVERQLIEKFQKNNFKAVSGGFTAFVHIGKSIILILVAPPYFLLFIIPKWAFQNLMPAAEKVNELMEEAWKHVSAWTIDIFGIFSLKLNELRAKMQRKKKAPKPQKEKELDPRIVEFKQKWNDFLKRLVRAQENFSNSVANLRIRLFEQFNAKRTQMIMQVKSLLETGRQKINDAAEKLQLSFIRWMQPKIEKAARVFSALDRGLEKVVLTVSVPLKKTFEATARVLQPLIPAAKVAVQFLQIVISPPMQFFFKQSAKAAQTAKSLIIQSASAVQKVTTAVVHSMSVMAQTAFRPLAVASVWTAQEAMRGAHKVAKRIGNVSATLGIAMKRAVLSCLDKGKEQAKKFLQWAGEQATVAGKALLSAVMMVKHLPGLLRRLAKFLLGLVYRIWRKFSHSFRVIYVLTKHLVRQSLVQLERSLHKTQ